MGIFDFFKKKKESNDFVEEGVDKEPFYEVIETNVVLYNKSGEEIASGFICFTIYINQFNDALGHERFVEDYYMFYNGKRIYDGEADNEYDYDSVEWGEERELQRYDNYDDALKYLEEITS